MKILVILLSIASFAGINASWIERENELSFKKRQIMSLCDNQESLRNKSQSLQNSLYLDDDKQKELTNVNEKLSSITNKINECSNEYNNEIINDSRLKTIYGLRLITAGVCLFTIGTIMISKGLKK